MKALNKPYFPFWFLSSPSVMNMANELSEYNPKVCTEKKSGAKTAPHVEPQQLHMWSHLSVRIIQLHFRHYFGATWSHLFS